MKIALIHDFLTSYTGAERVLKAISELYPKAPIYTILHDENGLGGAFDGAEIRTSFIQGWPAFMKKKRKFLLPFLSVAVENFDLSEFDVVISSSGAWSKGVITRTDAVHICYCHTPMRFVWDWTHHYQRESGLSGWKQVAASPLLNSVRTWDQVSAKRVDFWIANSKTVAGRVNKYYRSEAKVIYPNVDIERFKGETRDGDYYFSVGRLEPYKNVSLLIEAFNKRPDLSLKIVGKGSMEKALRKQIKSPGIELLGYKTDEEVRDLILGCKGFLFPVEDDFGITPVEAMAAGKPVVALKAGGVRETVLDGKTGVFFDKPESESLLKAIEVLENTSWNKDEIRKRAELFSEERFKREFRKYVEETIALKLKAC